MFIKDSLEEINGVTSVHLIVLYCSFLLIMYENFIDLIVFNCSWCDLCLSHLNLLWERESLWRKLLNEN